MPLGLMLLSRGVLNPEQLKTALALQQATGGRIGDVIQELGFATQEQITSAVAAQWGYPIFPLGGNPVETKIRIPQRLMELYRMLPVHFVESGRRLLVAFVDSVQHQILYTVERMTDCVPMPCFITAGEYQRQLCALVISAENEELAFERGGDAPEMARIVRNYVLQIHAEEARFGICRDYLWARIHSRRREMDLLFRLQTA
jgi:hypothetical protein